MRLSIVIVHYNTPEDLGRCLESLRAQAPACDHEVVVVDNASTAPGLDDLQAANPDVRWIRNTENLGYGKACNQGMALVPADYHLVLNPDIVVLPGALDALVNFADENPRAGIIGPQLLNEDGTIQDSCRRFYTFWTLILRRTFVGKLRPNSQTVTRHLMHDFDHASVRPVDWVLGGCLLVSREALDRCGPMDDRFFLYFEDVDWCYRMWQCGLEVLYLPDARFIHRHRRSSASGKFNRSFWLHLTSLISFYEKWSLVVYVAKKWRRPVEVASHWVLDMVLLALALLGAYGLRWAAQPLFDTELLRLSWYGDWFLWSMVMVTSAFVLMGRYGGAAMRRGLAWGPHLRQMGMVALLLLAGSYLGREQVVSRAVLVAFLGIYAVLSAWALRTVHGLHERLTRGNLALERTLLVGPTASLRGWMEGAQDPRGDGVDVVGYVSADADRTPLAGGSVPWLGNWEQLLDLVERFRVSQVAFWQRPADEEGSWRELLALRQRRVRLRWILDEAWLLEVGARADRFGDGASGVLDPDDGHALRRGALRIPEVITAALFMLVSLVLWPWRQWRRRQGGIQLESAEVLDQGELTVAVASDGGPVPIWWQWSLLVALLKGQIGLIGAPLAGHVRQDDPARWLRDADAHRPGLTGPWARKGEQPASVAALWRTFFMNPGGWVESPPTGEEV